MVSLLATGCTESESDPEVTGACNDAECADAMGTDQGPSPQPDATPPMDQTVGQVTVTPESFEFSYVAPGDTQDQTIRVTNVGGAPIDLSDFAAAFSIDYTLYWQRGGTPLPRDEEQLVFREG